MAYRDDRDALEERVQQLERELAAERERNVDRSAAELREVRRKLAIVTKENLAFDRVALHQRAQRTRLVAAFAVALGIAITAAAVVDAIESRGRAQELETALLRSERHAAARPPAPTRAVREERAVGGEVGNLAPAITVHALDGTRIDLRGGVTVVQLFASWAQPATREMPMLDRTYRGLRGRGLLVVGISADSSLADLRAAIGVAAIDYPVVHDEGRTITAAFAPGALPTTYVIDQGGVIRFVLHGYRDGDEEALDRQIRAALDAPPEAP